ncbi:MAG: DUF1826 domain-containing protein [Pseudomonadota bacterium]
MNIVTRAAVAQPAGVSIARDARGLESFRDPACAATIWDREMPSDVISWLDELASEVLPNGRAALQAQAVSHTVLRLCNIAGMPNGWQRDWLIVDIADLARRFADLMQVAYVRLRLRAVTTNACRKFHLDAINGRLVCTYRATGTQYGTSMRGEDPEHIFTAPTGAPTLLRGSLWPPNPTVGLLHRSPRLRGRGKPVSSSFLTQSLIRRTRSERKSWAKQLATETALQ